MAKQINTTPTIQTYKGKQISFYSPVQLEAIIPPDKRLPRQEGSSFSEYKLGSSKKGVRELV